MFQQKMKQSTHLHITLIFICANLWKKMIVCAYKKGENGTLYSLNSTNQVRILLLGYLVSFSEVTYFCMQGSNLTCTYIYILYPHKYAILEYIFVTDFIV
jgi:hypothetical protein